MHHHATGTFSVDSWEEAPYDEREGARLSRVHLTKTFRGDMVGQSTTDILIALAQVENSRAYVGLERSSGTLNGRHGSFVLQHVATASASGHPPAWTILPDSGTDALAGISGDAQIVIDAQGGHPLTLDY